MGTLFLYHCTKGAGAPFAEQMRVTELNRGTKIFADVTEVIVGAIFIATPVKKRE